MKKSDLFLTAVFLLFTAGMLMLGLIGTPRIVSELRGGTEGNLPFLEKISHITKGSESALNKALDRPHVFIELYGAVQRLTNRRVVEDSAENSTVVRLRDDALIFRIDNGDISSAEENASRTAAFAERLDDIPFLTVIAPDKVPTGEKGAAQLPESFSNTANDLADAYTSSLSRYGVPVLDLRPAFDESPERDSYFFRTDHHWTPEGAFFACGIVTERLAQLCDLTPNAAALDEGNYDKEVYRDFFLGSQGKRVGSLYAGSDDFTVYTPRFDTALRYEIPERELVQTGNFNEALCFPERIAERNLFYGNPYTYYSGGDWAEAVMKNEANPDGVRIVMIRDSFACALAPFLALQCGELRTIDLRYFSGDPAAYIEALQPDAVVLCYTASSTRLGDLFAFS